MPYNAIHSHFSEAEIDELYKEAISETPFAIKEISSSFLQKMPKTKDVAIYEGDPHFSAIKLITEQMKILDNEITIEVISRAERISKNTQSTLLTLHIDSENELEMFKNVAGDSTLITFSERDFNAIRVAKKLLHKRPLVTPSDIEKAVSALYSEQENESVFFEGLMLISSQSRISANMVKRSASEVSSFFVDVEHAGLAEFMKKLENERLKVDLKNSLIEQPNELITGMQLAHPQLEQAVIFLPDASEPGRFRASYFDKKGFFSHATRDTYSELIELVWRDGFTNIEKKMLEEWCVLKSWSEGSELTLVIQQINLGKLEHSAFVGVSQWQNYGSMIKKLADNLDSSALEINQKISLLIERVRHETGFSLNENFASELIREPQKKPEIKDVIFDEGKVIRAVERKSNILREKTVKPSL